MLRNNRDSASRRALRNLGVSQSFATRWADSLVFGVGAISAALIGIIPKRYPDVLVDFSGLATATIAAAAAIVALRQWRHLRNEATIAGALSRLDLVNTYFMQPERYEVISPLFQGSPGWPANIHNWASWSQDMYVFIELDNLQYGVEKYRLGYSTPYQALRSVDLFAARCQSNTFYEAARRLVETHAGSYTEETVSVVRNMKQGDRFLPLFGQRTDLPSNERLDLTAPREQGPEVASRGAAGQP